MNKEEEKEKKKKAKFYKMLDDKTGVLSNPQETYYDIQVNGFPAVQCEEWIKNCKEGFNGCRWLKAWTDHLKAKQFDAIVSNGAVQYQSEVNSTKEKEENKEDIPKVFGDGER